MEKLFARSGGGEGEGKGGESYKTTKVMVSVCRLGNCCITHSSLDSLHDKN